MQYTICDDIQLIKLENIISIFHLKHDNKMWTWSTQFKKHNKNLKKHES